MTSGEPYSESRGNTDLPPNYRQDDSTGSSATQQVADKARQGADQVKQAASAATDQVKQSAKSQASSQKDQAAQSLNTVSQAVNQAAQQLRQNNQAPMAQIAETAAANISQFSGYLQNRNINDLIGDVEDFASSQPALFLGGAFLLGVLGARFLKSSRASMSQPSSRQLRGQQQWGGSRTGYASRGQYGSQYGSYGRFDNTGYTTGMAGAQDNINTGGLAYGRNRPADGSEYLPTSRPANSTTQSLTTDENIISGESPR